MTLMSFKQLQILCLEKGKIINEKEKVREETGEIMGVTIKKNQLFHNNFVKQKIYTMIFFYYRTFQYIHLE